MVTDPVPAAQTADICDARRLFPATADRVYFNTAAVGLASRRLAATYHQFIDEWTAIGLDYSRGERAADAARSAVARLIGADVSDIALIPSVSSATGLIAVVVAETGSGARTRADDLTLGPERPDVPLSRQQRVAPAQRRSAAVGTASMRRLTMTGSLGADPNPRDRLDRG